MYIVASFLGLHHKGKSQAPFLRVTETGRHGPWESGYMYMKTKRYPNQYKHIEFSPTPS